MQMVKTRQERPSVYSEGRAEKAGAGRGHPDVGGNHPGRRIPAGIYPLEIYSDERIRGFDEADRMDRKVAARLTKALRR